jgi:hypothetical protein
MATPWLQMGGAAPAGIVIGLTMKLFRRIN